MVLGLHGNNYEYANILTPNIFGLKIQKLIKLKEVALQMPLNCYFPSEGKLRTKISY